MGQLRKGCSHLRRRMGLAEMGPAASQDPVGTRSSPHTPRCPTGRCWGWGALRSPSGHPPSPHQKKTQPPHTGRSSRSSRPPPQLTCTDSWGPASHVHPPTRLMPPVPEKGRDAAWPSASAASPPPPTLLCQLPHPPPGSPRKKGTPSPCAPWGGDKPKATLAAWPRYAQQPSPRGRTGGEGDSGETLPPPGPKCPQNPRAPTPEPPLCPNCPSRWVPPNWVPSSHQIGYHQDRYHHATVSGTTKPLGDVPLSWVSLGLDTAEPLGRVPRSHQVMYH